jgi:hypothetical protein
MGEKRHMHLHPVKLFLCDDYELVLACQFFYHLGYEGKLRLPACTYLPSIQNNISAPLVL